MATKVYIDGRVVPPEEATVSIFDRGFLYGDSIYEVTRTVRGRPLELGPHLDRLERSAEAIALPLPPRADVVRAIDETLAAAGNAESYVRVMVTRGEGPINLDPASAERPRLVVLVKPMELPPAKAYSEGVAVCIVGVQRNLRRAVDPRVKSGNYLNNVLALAEAKKTGAYEALMCDFQGRLAEGSTSNFFFVRAGELFTPPLDVGILEGITRQRVMGLARKAGLTVHEAELWPHDVASFSEAFLTSSVRGIVPVVTLDGAPVGIGAPGPVTRRVMAAYAAYLEAA